MNTGWFPGRLVALLLVLAAFSGWRLWRGEAPGSVLLTALVVVLVFAAIPVLTDWWVRRMRGEGRNR